MVSTMQPYEKDGTPCEMFIDGYCTDLSPKEPGCVGKEHCRRFEGSSLRSDIESIKEEVRTLITERESLRASQKNMHKRARSAEMALKTLCERIIEEVPNEKFLIFTAKEIQSRYEW